MQDTKINLPTLTENERNYVNKIFNEYFIKLDNTLNLLEELLSSTFVDGIDKSHNIVNIIKYLNDNNLVYGMCYFIKNHKLPGLNKIYRCINRLTENYIEDKNKSYICDTPVKIFDINGSINILYTKDYDVLFKYIYNKNRNNVIEILPLYNEFKSCVSERKQILKSFMITILEN